MTGSGAAAQQTDGQGVRLAVGFTGSVGSALTGRPEDTPGYPTLLYGTGFSGSSVRFGPTFAGHVLPWFSATTELTVGRTQVSGFAAVDDTRRDVTFALWSIQLLPMAVASVDLGAVELHSGVGIGVRTGLVATARESRINIDDAASAPAVRTGTVLPAAAEVGASVSAGDWEVQAAIRFTYALNYPSSTLGRLDAYRSPRDAGAYWVENDFDTMLVLTLWKSLTKPPASSSR